jgi:hypothetical protein
MLGSTTPLSARDGTDGQGDAIDGAMAVGLTKLSQTVAGILGCATALAIPWA